MGDGSFTILVLFSLGFLVYVLIFALFQVYATIWDNLGHIYRHAVWPHMIDPHHLCRVCIMWSVSVAAVEHDGDRAWQEDQ